MQFFKDASRLATFSTNFPYLYRHLSANIEKYKDEAAFIKLSMRSEKLPSGVEQRYNALLYEPYHLLHIYKGDEFQFGCMNARNGCDLWKSYWTLKGKFVMGYNFNDEDIIFLRQFGRNLKYCRRYVEL